MENNRGTLPYSFTSSSAGGIAKTKIPDRDDRAGSHSLEREGCLSTEQKMIKWEGEGVSEHGAVTLEEGPRPVEIYRFLQGLSLPSGSEQQVDPGDSGFLSLFVMHRTE